MVWDRSPHAVMIALRSTKMPCFCRPGDQSWSPVECLEELSQVSSITYCDGAFYLFDAGTRKTVCLDSETFAVSAVIEPPPAQLMREPTLAVSSAELIMIGRTHVLPPGGFDGPVKLRRARAFRWDRRNPTSWAAVEDIGNRAVFVDSFRGFYVEANGFNGVRRNCVYVASSHPSAKRDGSEAAWVATQPRWRMVMGGGLAGWLRSVGRWGWSAGEILAGSSAPMR
uniref:KIB1-4 beta-propeller domain-containing protein n=1 Tax=Aegilops tauschii TaxID=37682 RepID=M8AP51_AEGTA